MDYCGSNTGHPERHSKEFEIRRPLMFSTVHSFLPLSDDSCSKQEIKTSSVGLQKREVFFSSETPFAQSLATS